MRIERFLEQGGQNIYMSKILPVPYASKYSKKKPAADFIAEIFYSAMNKVGVRVCEEVLHEASHEAK